MTIVCGDSHTSTHGAFGALAFGIGTSEVEHVLATQTPAPRRCRAPCASASRASSAWASARRTSSSARSARSASPARQGHVIEYAGSAIRALSMEGRMTVCNMSIEGGGARRHDRARRHHLRASSRAARARRRDFAAAVERWRDLPSDWDAALRPPRSHVDAASLAPQVTWGTNPGMVAPVTGRVPTPDEYDDPADRDGVRRALEYMGLRRRRGDRGHRGRRGLHRLVHQRPPPRPARRGRGRARPAGRRRASARWSCPARCR